MEFSNKQLKLSPISEDPEISKLCLHCNGEVYKKFGDDDEYCYKCSNICSHCNDRVGWVDINHTCMLCLGCDCRKCRDLHQC